MGLYQIWQDTHTCLIEYSLLVYIADMGEWLEKKALI